MKQSSAVEGRVAFATSESTPGMVEILAGQGDGRVLIDLRDVPALISTLQHLGRPSIARETISLDSAA
jgi:hypothetical protein